MLQGPVGAHPQNPVPQGRCGSFSFLGRDKPLVFIWTQQGHIHPTVALIRSQFIGTATITFHPTFIIQLPNGPWQYTFFTNVHYALVPNLAEFCVYEGQQQNPLLPVFNHMYSLSFLFRHRFDISGVAWEG